MICEYVLAANSVAFGAFKKFKALVENNRGHSMKMLRTDRGGDFLSKEFSRFCEEHGIERHLTAMYTSQQNSVVEHRNHTVMAMARSLLKSMHVPRRFWGEAGRHVAYLLNRLPAKVTGEHTLFEAWTDKKLHLSHLRVFGCTAHVKVVVSHPKKLGDRSSSMVYLGVEEGSKAHCLYDPHHDKLHVSRDVIFQEDMECQWDAGANRDAHNSMEFTVVEDLSHEPTVGGPKAATDASQDAMAEW